MGGPRADDWQVKADSQQSTESAREESPQDYRVMKSNGETVSTVATLAKVPARWRWHYRTLQGLRDRLLAAHRALHKYVMEPVEPHSLHLADSASDEFEHELALTELAADQNALYEVEEALRRIGDGGYGICQESGKPIPAARLRAIPWTRFTREVKERLERQRTNGPYRLGTLGSVRDEAPGDLAESELEEEKEKELPGAPEESLHSIPRPPS